MLADEDTKRALFYSLQRCHAYRMHYYNILLNVGLIVGGILLAWLLYTYRSQCKRNSRALIAQQQEYILGRIRDYQDDRLHQRRQPFPKYTDPNPSSSSSLPVLL